MKKQIKFLFIVLFVFIVCLSISIIIKHFFGLDGDYLSAFSTSVAAVVAFYLYSDWREQYILDLIRESDNNINVVLGRLIKSTQNFQEYLSQVIEKDPQLYCFKDFDTFFNDFLDHSELLLLELDKQKLILKNMQKTVEIDKAVIQSLDNITAEITQKIKDLSNEHLVSSPLILCKKVFSLLDFKSGFINRLRESRYVVKNNLNFVIDIYLKK